MLKHFFVALSAESAAQGLINAADSAKTNIFTLFIGILNQFVIPVIMGALAVLMLFDIVGIAKGKKQGVPDAVQEHARNLAIKAVIFVIAAGYMGIVWANLFG